MGVNGIGWDQSKEVLVGYVSLVCLGSDGGGWDRREGLESGMCGVGVMVWMGPDRIK